MNCLTVTRREAIKGLAAVSGLLAVPSMTASAMTQKLLWGVSTSAYQVEGNNINTDIWALEQMQGSMFKERSGDACDHYHRYREDIALFAKLGFNAYRFSVEWARVEPAEGQFSNAELDHYAAMAEACRADGIVPCFTLHHFSSPMWLARQGGWENTESAQLFARYCGLVAKTLGPLSGAYFTINEINLPPELARYRRTPAFAGFAQMQEKAQQALSAPKFSSFLLGDPEKAGPVLIQAHQLAVKSIKAVSPDVPVGMTLALRDHQALPGGEEKLRAIQATDYEPYFAMAKQDDFVAIQTYSRVRVDATGELPAPAEKERTQTGWEFYPGALEESVRYAAKATGKPVWITENGIATDDDARRIEYIRRATQGLQRCMDDGIPVGGYFHWSAFDNFEWTSGYGPKFGLISVDRKTFVRTPKASASFLGKLNPPYAANEIKIQEPKR